MYTHHCRSLCHDKEDDESATMSFISLNQEKGLLLEETDFCHKKGYEPKYTTRKRENSNPRIRQ